MIATPSGVETVRWSNAAFARVARLAAERTGLTFPENRRDITESAMRRAMQHAAIADPDAFADRITIDASAFSDALMELTIGETYFFRDPAQWDLIRTRVVPSLLGEHPDGRGVRAWSAGCASGEEAYTLGIVLRECGIVDPVVVGSDLCRHRLARAARGVYTKWSMRGLDAESRRRYFRESAQHFHLLPEFRDVTFAPVNLAENEYGEGHALSRLDLILCRNVLIYLSQDVVERVFERLVSALRDGGWLMVAASDPQPLSSLPLDVVLTEAGLLYRKRAAVAEPEPVRVHLDVPEPQAAAAPAVRFAIPRAPARPRSDAEELGIAYRDARYDRVIGLARVAIDEGKDAASTWIALVRARANMGDITAAFDDCADGVLRHPDASELHVVASALALQAGRLNEAAQAARRATYVDRSLATGHLALGSALLRMGDPAAADRSLRAAEQLLATMRPDQVVPASDGSTAHALLGVVRAHRALVAQRAVADVR